MKHIFIVNPYAGEMSFANNLREQLEAIEGLEFYLFNSRYRGNETELVQKVCSFFPDEQIRIYVCGGSGTMKYVLDGIDDFERVEVAFYPCGASNDFLKVIPLEDRDRFSDIEELITGDVVECDYMQTSYGRALNSVSFGLDTQFLEEDYKNRTNRGNGEKVNYLWNVFKALRKIDRMNVRLFIDGHSYDARYMEIVFLNGRVFGGSLGMGQDFVHNNGRANYMLLPSKGFFYFVSVIIDLARQNDKKVKEKVLYGTDMKNVVFVRKDKSDLLVNLDGEVCAHGGEWNLEVVKGGLKFVVPRGVKLTNALQTAKHS